MAAQQTESDPGDRTEGMGTALKRRGLIAGAAALVAGIVAKQTSQPVAARTFDDRFIANGSGGVGFDTAVRQPGDPYLDIGIRAQGIAYGVYGSGSPTQGIGVLGGGSGTDPGVLGNGGDNSGTGVQGTGGGTNGTGVSGHGNGNGAGVIGGGGLYGVKGSVGDSGYGVHGTAGIGYGVYGTAPTGIGVGGDSNNVGVAGRGGGDTSGNTTGFPVGVRGSVADTGFGVYGNAGNGTAVYGNVTGGNGVTGVAVTGNGVTGQAARGASKGVYGKHTGGGYGVYGEGVNGHGVYGTVGDGGYGVTGVATTSYGVVGQSTSGTGIQGQSTSGIGVTGTSGRAIGVFGVAGDQSGAAGLLGYSNTANGAAFGSVVTAPATLAGYFNGEVHVVGPFIVDDPANKHGAIDHTDGTTRLVYSMESPESWIEDFGTGTLSNGKASIALDPGFAGVVHTDDYHVFLTAHDAEHQLAVTARAGQGFSVQGSASAEATAKGKKAADLSGTFSYRVVAKPKVGRVVERLPKYTRPVFDIAAVEKLAKAATIEKPLKKP